jgi:hypothetical protein
LTAAEAGTKVKKMAVSPIAVPPNAAALRVPLLYHIEVLIKQEREMRHAHEEFTEYKIHQANGIREYVRDREEAVEKATDAKFSSILEKLAVINKSRWMMMGGVLTVSALIQAVGGVILWFLTHQPNLPVIP